MGLECAGGVKAMKLRSTATVSFAVTLITMAICFFGVRAELARGHGSANQGGPQVMQLNRSDADRYCAQPLPMGVEPAFHRHG
jgi:hypothetical protein